MTTASSHNGRLRDVLPDDLEAERKLIGSLLLRLVEVERVRTIIRPDDILSPDLREIYEAIVSVYDRGIVEPDDLLIVAELKAIGSWSDRTVIDLAELARTVATGHNAPRFAEMVRDAAQRRAYYLAGADMMHDARELTDLDEIERRFAERVEGLRVGRKMAKPILSTMTAAELVSSTETVEYLCDGVLVRHQPCIVAAPKKCLKTSIMIDLSLSLATGGHFLGKRAVHRACRVAMFSGESGIATIRETAMRIAAAARITLSDVDGFIVSSDLPRLNRPDHRAAFRELVRRHGIDVAIIDPAYLAIDTEGSESSMFAMGAVLGGMAELCAELGVTLILVHHTRKHTTTNDPFAPPELENIAFSGFQEFARQWILLARRELYVPSTGVHRLWLSTGGSAGHSHLWAVNVAEGVYKPDTPRSWVVEVMDPAQARGELATRKRDEKMQVQADRELADRERLIEIMYRYPDGETQTVLRTAAGLSGSAFRIAIATLLNRGRAEPVRLKKHTRIETAYRLREGV